MGIIVKCKVIISSITYTGIGNDTLQDNTILEKFQGIRYLILDEADRMIEGGHFQELENILRLLRRREPEMQE